MDVGTDFSEVAATVHKDLVTCCVTVTSLIKSIVIIPDGIAHEGRRVRTPIDAGIRLGLAHRT